MLTTAFLISCSVNYLSSGISTDSWVCALSCLCYSLSSFWLSSGVKYLIMCVNVSCRFVVSVLSGFFNVVIFAACFLFPAASLYISVQGLVAEATLQNSLHDAFLSFLMVAAYSALVPRYCNFRWSRRSLLPLVRWYWRRCAFTFFLKIANHSVQQGTDMRRCLLCFRKILNELLQADARTSWRSSTIVSMLGALATLKPTVSSSSSVSPNSLFDPQIRCSISWRFTWNFSLSFVVTLYLTPVFTPVHQDVLFPCIPDNIECLVIADC